jgi:2-polyprenyl-3-methyl-5-hydroxy-6-metoxy-1,4-benzoquinol methylase
MKNDLQLNFEKKCPICGTSDFSFNFKKIRNNFDLAECRECNFKFAYPRPTLNFIIDYYNKIPNHRFFKISEKKATNDCKHLLNQIKRYHPNAKRILEIGCSAGYYLFAFKKLGYQVYGTEFSSDAISLAKEWFDVNIFLSEFPPNELKGYFDVIIIHHVIEHVIEPRKFLNSAVEFLNNGGIGIVQTPNYNSIGMKMFKENYPVLCPPGHLNFFTSETLARTVPDNFEIILNHSTSSAKNDIYNWFVGMMALIKVKEILKQKVSKEIIISNLPNCSNNPISSNRKYIYQKSMLKFTEFIHLLFIPLFYFLDKVNLGENLDLIIKKKK